jgi:propanol-preferring alcohol dehydrogenase
VDGRWAARIPEGVSFETAAPLACAGCTIYKGVLVAGLERGAWLGIVGSGGGLGHLGVQFARALGMRVVGVDARDQGLELTRRYGAEVVIDARQGEEEIVKEVHRVTNGEGVAATVNVSEAATAAAMSCKITRMHGTVVQIAQVGIWRLVVWSETNALQPENVVIPFQEIIFRDIRIRGSLICSAKEAQDMLQVVAEHTISVNTNAFNGLGEMEKLIELAESGKMKGKGIVIIDQAQVDAERKILV